MGDAELSNEKTSFDVDETESCKKAKNDDDANSTTLEAAELDKVGEIKESLASETKSEIEKTPGDSSTNSDNGSAQQAVEAVEDEEKEVELRVMFNKKLLLINISLKKTVGDLKKKIEVLTKVSPALQKVLIKGVAKDEVILESLGLSNGSKFFVIGSSLDEVMEVAKPPDLTPEPSSAKGSTAEGQNWCTLTQHRKILDKGIPDDAMPGILYETDSLPPFPLSGMISSRGSKVRLTFKLETDELWIGTKERTEKVPMGSIRSVVSQPITGHEEYHILGIQLGPTEASRYFVYWVPAQYIEAIKEVLG